MPAGLPGARGRQRTRRGRASTDLGTGPSNGWTIRPSRGILRTMSITLYYVGVTIMLGSLVGLLLGGGFAFGCRLSELDDTGGDAEES